MSFGKFLAVHRFHTIRLFLITAVTARTGLEPWPLTVSPRHELPIIQNAQQNIVEINASISDRTLI
jgi:hypothetical protein